MLKWFCSLALIIFISGCSFRPPPQTTLQITITEDRLEPGNWRIQAGAEIQVEIINHDTGAQILALMALPAKEPFDAADVPNIFWQVKVEAGRVLTQFRAPIAAGDYQLLSTLPGRLENGMYGWITVIQPGY